MKHLLDSGLAALGIEANEQQRANWLAYVSLLVKWNRAYNLTAVRDPIEMVSRHVLDSLSIAKHIQGTHLLDVGAGAGIPSIPLAILWPDSEITAVDSNGKKVRFMQQVREELKLGNFSALQVRVEDYQTNRRFDGIISRAFASLGTFTKLSQHLLAPDGTLWAMKAIIDTAELSEVQKPYKVSACLPLQVPDCVAERHLVVIRHEGVRPSNTL